MNEGSEGGRGLTRGLCELTLEARDPSSLAAFYKDVFGWQELSREDERVWLACGAWSRLGLWTAGPKEFGDEEGRHVRFALSVRPGKLDELSRRVAEMGIAHRGPVRHEGGDRSLCFEDSEGNVVEIWDFFEHSDGACEGVEALTAGSEAV